ncbi:MAG: Uma2 family endonuclease, partial [Spirulinaceae cyanobacterium]
ICPDFVVELRSSSDTLKSLQEKMREYIENGAKLGWLIDPKQRRVEIYRLGKEVEVLENPAELSGEEVLQGFVLDLRRVWA